MAPIPIPDFFEFSKKHNLPWRSRFVLSMAISSADERDGGLNRLQLIDFMVNIGMPEWRVRWAIWRLTRTGVFERRGHELHLDSWWWEGLDERREAMDEDA